MNSYHFNENLEFQAKRNVLITIKKKDDTKKIVFNFQAKMERINF